MNQARRKRRNRYTVVQVKGHTAVITPAGRKGNAKASGKPSRLTVYSSLKVKPGDRVQIGLATRRQSVFGFLSLAVPLLAAVTGHMAASRLAPQSERLKAVCTLAACLIALIVMGTLSRRHAVSDNTLQIVKVVPSR